MKASKPDLASALCLVVAPLLSVAAMSHHPSVAAAGTAERLAEITAEAGLSAAVHGALIALILLILFGLFELVRVLGGHAAPARLGLLAYGAGVVCMIGAAAISGFVVPSLAERWAEAAAPAMEGAVPALTLCFAANQALARIGVVAQSAAILVWSGVLLARRGAWPRAIGGFGVLAAALPAAGIVAGSLRLDVHGMLAVVLAQSAWTIAVGLWLLRLRGDHGGSAQTGEGAG